jgi:hypothetical protein
MIAERLPCVIVVDVYHSQDANRRYQDPMYTVAASFDKFRENIELSGDHRSTATARKDDIVATLSKHFEVLDAFPSGSIPRYTALRKYADLDVIVVLHYGKHVENKKPSELLKSVQSVLSEYKTGVRRNGQAVTLSYKTWPNVDIVPVSRVVNDDKSINYYSVPNMNNETWLKTRPRSHDKALEDRNAVCGDLFKRIIKMIKWWNHQHSEYLQSFHIEVMALNIFTQSLSAYPWEIYRYFEQAAILAKTPLWHDIGFADVYLDYSTRAEAVKRLETARDKARDAWYLTYGERDDHKGAIEIWRQIFGDEFPAYGG